jgi:hypothetical protein
MAMLTEHRTLNLLGAIRSLIADGVISGAIVANRASPPVPAEELRALNVR